MSRSYNFPLLISDSVNMTTNVGKMKEKESQVESVMAFCCPAVWGFVAAEPGVVGSSFGRILDLVAVLLRIETLLACLLHVWCLLIVINQILGPNVEVSRFDWFKKCSDYHCGVLKMT